MIKFLNRFIQNHIQIWDLWNRTEHLQAGYKELQWRYISNNLRPAYVQFDKPTIVTIKL